MNHLIYILVLQICITSCGPDVAKEPSKPSEGIAGLEIMYEERLASYEDATAEFSGWPSLSDCDALLWSGLASFAGSSVALDLAEYSPGEWHRRPAPSCWTEAEGDVGSKSTISNDMLLGLMLSFWRTKDLKAAQRLADYGEANKWVMGAPFPEMASRVVLKPNQIGLLGKLIEKLSDGQDLRSYRKLPSVYLPVTQDFERHIQTIGILLHGELDDQILSLMDVTGSMYARLEENHLTDPDDAFLAAVFGLYEGDLETPINLLLDPNYVSPSYVRGHEKYHDVHWLAAAKVVLDHAGEL